MSLNWICMLQTLPKKSIKNVSGDASVAFNQRKYSAHGFASWVAPNILNEEQVSILSFFVLSCAHEAYLKSCGARNPHHFVPSCLQPLSLASPVSPTHARASLFEFLACLLPHRFGWVKLDKYITSLGGVNAFNMLLGLWSLISLLQTVSDLPGIWGPRLLMLGGL